MSEVCDAAIVSGSNGMDIAFGDDLFGMFQDGGLQ